MARIIVTGSTGFLGQALVPALEKEGHSVVKIDRRPDKSGDTVVADVRELDSMMEYIKDADAVFHLASLIEAGESVKEPQKFIDWNISGTLNVLEAMRENGIRHFLFSSSAAIYGDPAKIPIQEDDRTLPVNPYGMTKLAMEGLLSSYVKAHGFTGTALRYFNLYGPKEHHEPETHGIPRFIDQMLHGESVTQFGDGQHLRDYIYIDDVVSAHITALKNSFDNYGKYHYFNISTGQGATVREVIDKLGALLGIMPIVNELPERPGDPRQLLADPTKANTVLGWSAQVSLDEGLAKTVAYFTSLHEDAPKPIASI